MRVDWVLGLVLPMLEIDAGYPVGPVSEGAGVSRDTKK